MCAHNYVVIAHTGCLVVTVTINFSGDHDSRSICDSTMTPPIVIEIRSEESFDVQPYTNNRRHEKIVVPLEGDIEQLRCEYLTVCTYTYVRVRMFHCCLCLHWE